jgi:hypothetical protein
VRGRFWSSTSTGRRPVSADDSLPPDLPFLEARLGADHVALLRRVKRAFDPAGILNPGKLGS